MELHTSISIDSRSIHEKNRITTLGSSLSFLGIKPLHSDIRTCKDEMPAGETPCTIALYVRDDLVDAIQPGDRVEVTGIYRAIPLRVNPKTRNVKSVYKTHIEVLHFRKSNAKRLYEVKDEEELHSNLTPERVMQLRALCKEGDIYERLSRAIAPDIFENEDVKKVS